MSVLTVAMDTGRVAGMEMEWHQELATHGHGAEVLIFPSVFYHLQGQGLSVCTHAYLSQAHWLSDSSVKAKPDYTD